MTTQITTHNPVRSDLPPTVQPTGQPTGQPTAQPGPAVGPGTRTGRGWAVAGLGAALTAIVGISAAWSIDAVYTEGGDRDAIVEALTDEVPAMIAFHVLMSVSAVLLGIFALGLFRRLRAALPAESLLPGVAAFGLLATSVVVVLGTGLDTEFSFAAGDPDQVVPESLVFYNHWIGTVPMVWMMVGLTGLALFAAARRRAVSRVVGCTGLVLGGLTLLLGISPLQYMAGMTGPLMLLVVAAALTFGDKAHRA